MKSPSSRLGKLEITKFKIRKVTTKLNKPETPNPQEILIFRNPEP